MKGLMFLLLSFVLFCKVILAQPALKVSQDDKELMSIIFNPGWIKAHAVKEIVWDDMYGSMTKPIKGNTTRILFDSAGYRTTEFETKNGHPDEQNFERKTTIQYFIYGHALIKKKQLTVRNQGAGAFDYAETNVLADNPGRLNELVIGPDTFSYKFNEMNSPTVISETGGRKVRLITYNKSGQVRKIEVKHKDVKTPATYSEYDYYDDGQLKSAKLYASNHLTTRMHFEYDDKGYLTKSFVYMFQKLAYIGLYRYF
jgi:hypothetical protein